MMISRYTLLWICLLPLVPPAVSADDLAARIAAATYRPITAAKVQQRRDAALEARQDAGKMIALAGGDPAWPDYLLFAPLDAALASSAVDDDVIDAVTQTIYRLAGLHDGIERPELTALRSRLIDLRRSLLAARRQAAAAAAVKQHERDLEQFPDDPELRVNRPKSIDEMFLQRTAELVELISRLDRDAPQPETMRRLAETADWLQAREQLSELLSEVSVRFGRSNANLEASAAALATVTARQVFEVEPIRETQDKAQITGQAVLTGTAMLHPISGRYPGECEVRFAGTVRSTMNGRQGPVSFILTGDTLLRARKTVVLQADQFTVFQSVAEADSDLRTDQVCSKFHGGIGKLVRRIAAKEIAKEQPQGRRDLSKRSSESFLKRFDEDVAEEMSEARREFELEVQRSLLRLNIQPAAFDFLTDPSRLTVALRFDSGFASPANAVLTASVLSDLNVTLHESTINSICARIYAGRKIQNIRRELRILGLELSPEEEAEIPEGIGIHFADTHPIDIEFNENQLAIKLRGQTWFVEDSALVAMNVRFGYALEPRAGRFVAVRQPEVDITAPDGFRGGRFIQQKNVLNRRLLAELPEEFVFEPIPVEKLSDPVNRLGSLNVVHLQTAGGWLRAGLQGDRRGLRAWANVALNPVADATGKDVSPSGLRSGRFFQPGHADDVQVAP